MTPRDPERLASLASSGSRAELGDVMRSAQRRLPDDAAVARMAAHFGLVPPASGASGSFPSPVPPPAAASGIAGASVAVKLVLGAAGVGACVAAFFALQPRPVDVNHGAPRPGAPSAARTVEAPVPLKTAAAPEAEARPAPMALDDLPTEGAGPVIPLESLAPASGTNTVARGSVQASSRTEVDLVTKAQRALHSEPARTLALADEHRKLYPRGVLAQEREVLAIEALAALGRKSAASARARAFGNASPNSPYARRIARAVGDE